MASVHVINQWFLSLSNNMTISLPIVINDAESLTAENSACGTGIGKNGNVVSRYLDNLGERQPHGPLAKAPLPMSMAEAKARGWNELDVVFVTGDAYIDHPSFAMSILGRVLEAAGFRVGIVSQPDWHSCEPWKRFGRPKLFFGISAGNMDSMITTTPRTKRSATTMLIRPVARLGSGPTGQHSHTAKEPVKPTREYLL